MLTPRPQILLFLLILMGASGCGRHPHEAAPGGEQEGKSTQIFLDRFYAHPEQVMEESPPKYDLLGNRIMNSLFSDKEKRGGGFVEKKALLRKKLMGEPPGPGPETVNRSRILAEDLPERLVDNGANLLRNVFEMDKKNLTRATLLESPWSDDYWPTRYGILGKRYADPHFPSKGTWSESYRYILLHPVQSYIEKNKINLLSPAEKYDLLIGQGNRGPLTESLWAQGRAIQNNGREVEIWMGICHGWAAASYMLPRPLKPVKVSSFDGNHSITFFPADIKALGSLLWANAPGPSRFIGTRCQPKNPRRDGNGRILAQECFDNNPGTWHISLVNQVGISKRSFIFDATYDYEVWNQPVFRYTFHYFNPQTGKSFPTAQAALIPKEEFTRDLFTAYRSPEARSIVGVEMEVTYLFETNPSHRPVDSPLHDILQKTLYRYDLELDDEGKILGGEWYTNKHPDFLYTPLPNAKAVTFFDKSLEGTWNPLSEPPPEGWVQAAKKAARKEYPLAKIVETLFDFSIK